MFVGSFVVVDHMFSFVFSLFVILVISRFGFEVWIWVLIASVPDLFGVRVSVTFHLTCVHIMLVRVGLLSGHFLGNNCSLG